MCGEKIYADILLPLRIKGFFTYSIPDALIGKVSEGSWVNVVVRGREHLGIVAALRNTLPDTLTEEAVRPVVSLVERRAVNREELKFWREVADYYMCSVGEVFKAAYNVQLQRAVIKEQNKVGRRVKEVMEPDWQAEHQLSDIQGAAYQNIVEEFRMHRTVLLEGVTGSGKTEIYIRFAVKEIQSGRSVLYLVPEIAISKQLEERLRRVFGKHLLVFHSKQTIPQRKAVIETVASGGGIVLGTRSSVFLPFRNLGLVIVDEEHDQSYKQAEPAPRYNGRDVAVMLAAQVGAKVLLGSATPSFESIYNVQCGKFGHVVLNEKFHKSSSTEIKIIDTNEAWKHHEMHGSFSQELINEMRSTLSRGEQVMLFRSRRAYSPMVQCKECGEIPKCPHCNVNLSYHRFNNTLKCHFCGYSRQFSVRCHSCGEQSLAEKGAGTERVEEELKTFFPQNSIARFDADTTASKKQEEALIKDFASGKTDILVGTQMITKGFDFKNLSLVVLLNADSLFAVQDFRSDERTVQLITQLLGRAGRHGNSGRLIIQTAQKNHPALMRVSAELFEQRREFAYPPFCRLVTVVVKDRYEGRLWNVCRRLNEEFHSVKGAEIAGPVAPAIDYVDRQHICEFHIRLRRNASLPKIKQALSERIELVEAEFKGNATIIADVDPQ